MHVLYSSNTCYYEVRSIIYFAVRQCCIVYDLVRLRVLLWLLFCFVLYLFICHLTMYSACTNYTNQILKRIQHPMTSDVYTSRCYQADLFINILAIRQCVAWSSGFNFDHPWSLRKKKTTERKEPYAQKPYQYLLCRRSFGYLNRLLL